MRTKIMRDFGARANGPRGLQKLISGQPEALDVAIEGRAAPSKALTLSKGKHVYASSIAFERIKTALIDSGYTTLDEQARALGLARSTAWTIVKSKHKLGRLSAKVRERMLANPDLPPKVRLELQAAGAAGLDHKQSRRLPIARVAPESTEAA